VAWIFAQVLRCLCQLMGTTCISMYPYQLGHNNEEAIAAGAFWFYRKLVSGQGGRTCCAWSNVRRLESPRRRVQNIGENTAASGGGHVFYELPGHEGEPGNASPRET